MGLSRCKGQLAEIFPKDGHFIKHSIKFETRLIFWNDNLNIILGYLSALFKVRGSYFLDAYYVIISRIMSSHTRFTSSKSTLGNTLAHLSDEGGKGGWKGPNWMGKRSSRGRESVLPGPPQSHEREA